MTLGLIALFWPLIQEGCTPAAGAGRPERRLSGRIERLPAG